MTTGILAEVRTGKYGRCVQLENGKLQLMVTLDYGPRIMHFSLAGGQNVLCDKDGFVQPTYGDETWHIYGGHRLWHNPETYPRTYIADNQPVEYEIFPDGVELRQQVEAWAQIKKVIKITMDKKDSRVVLEHRLTNKNAWTVELAAWGVTLLAPGGHQIIPMPSRQVELSPNRVLALWPYSHMNDERVVWGDRYIFLEQRPQIEQPFKIGIGNEEGWAAYLNKEQLFIKRHEHRIGARYPDYGMSYETYLADYMVEMESLSPLTLLAPEQTLVHREEWELYGGIQVVEWNENVVDDIVNKYIKKSG